MSAGNPDGQDDLLYETNFRDSLGNEIGRAHV